MTEHTAAAITKLAQIAGKAETAIAPRQAATPFGLASDARKTLKRYERAAVALVGAVCMYWLAVAAFATH